MSETISVPVNLWLRGLHLGRERSHAEMEQVNDGQARSRAWEGPEGRRSGRLRCHAVAAKAVGGALGTSLLSHHSTISNNEN